MESEQEVGNGNEFSFSQEISRNFSSIDFLHDMIKRRFYRLDHADGDGASDSSASSSDFEPAAEASEESEDDVVEVKEDKGSCSTSSGYKSEDSSVNEVDNDTSGLLSNEAHDEVERERKIIIENHIPGNIHSPVVLGDFSLEKDSSQGQNPSCILKCKSVFKCRICPRIICLNEETLNAHLKSKRHARSEKLLKEGRLKAMLNSNGEFESKESEEQNTPPQDSSKRQNRRGKRQSTRQSKKKSRQTSKYSAKRMRKNED